MADSVAEKKYRRVRDIHDLLRAVRDRTLEDSFAVISDVTREVRDGKTVHGSYMFEGLADGADAEMLVRCNGDQVHIRKKVITENKGVFRFYEGTSPTSVGTELDLIRRNRNIAITTELQIFRDPTIDSASEGTLLSTELLAGGGKNAGVGATSTETKVWILKPNTDYLIQLENNSGGAQDISIIFDFFEVAP